jgi:hypothetical protein
LLDLVGRGDGRSMRFSDGAGKSHEADAAGYFESLQLQNVRLEGRVGSTTAVGAPSGGGVTSLGTPSALHIDARMFKSMVITSNTGAPIVGAHPHDHALNAATAALHSPSWHRAAEATLQSASAPTVRITAEALLPGDDDGGSGVLPIGGVVRGGRELQLTSRGVWRNFPIGHGVRLEDARFTCTVDRAQDRDELEARMIVSATRTTAASLGAALVPGFDHGATTLEVLLRFGGTSVATLDTQIACTAATTNLAPTVSLARVARRVTSDWGQQLSAKHVALTLQRRRSVERCVAAALAEPVEGGGLTAHRRCILMARSVGVFAGASTTWATIGFETLPLKALVALPSFADAVARSRAADPHIPDTEAAAAAGDAAHFAPPGGNGPQTGRIHFGPVFSSIRAPPQELDVLTLSNALGRRSLAAPAPGPAPVDILSCGVTSLLHCAVPVRQLGVSMSTVGGAPLTFRPVGMGLQLPLRLEVGTAALASAAALPGGGPLPGAPPLAPSGRTSDRAPSAGRASVAAGAAQVAACQPINGLPTTAVTTVAAVSSTPSVGSRTASPQSAGMASGAKLHRDSFHSEVQTAVPSESSVSSGAVGSQRSNPTALMAAVRPELEECDRALLRPYKQRVYANGIFPDPVAHAEMALGRAFEVGALFASYPPPPREDGKK